MNQYISKKQIKWLAIEISVFLMTGIFSTMAAENIPVTLNNSNITTDTNKYLTIKETNLLKLHTTITGDIDQEYVDNHIKKTNGIYLFNKDSIIYAPKNNLVNSVIHIPISGKDVIIDATGKTLTFDGNENQNVGFIFNESKKNQLKIKAKKININANGKALNKTYVNYVAFDGNIQEITGDISINLIGPENSDIYGFQNIKNCIINGNLSFYGEGLYVSLLGYKSSYPHVQINPDKDPIFGILPDFTTEKSLTVNGNVSVTAKIKRRDGFIHPIGVIASNNSIINFKGNTFINIENTSNVDGIGYALGAFGGKIFINVDKKNKNITPRNNTVTLIGNIGIVSSFKQDSSIYIALTNNKSSWSGGILDEQYSGGFKEKLSGNGKSVIYIILQNGAVWNQNSIDITGFKRNGMVTNFIGGSSEESNGFIYQKSNNSINIENYGGYTTIFYEHSFEKYKPKKTMKIVNKKTIILLPYPNRDTDWPFIKHSKHSITITPQLVFENQKDKEPKKDKLEENPQKFIQNEAKPDFKIIGGNTNITTAAPGSVITLLTNSDGLNTLSTKKEDVDLVNNTLNALANKLFYEGYKKGERNLIGKVGIAEGLTTPSVEKTVIEESKYEIPDSDDLKFISWKETGQGTYKPEDQPVIKKKPKKEPAVVKSAKNAIFSSTLVWQSQNNDLAKHLTDLRFTQEELGIWAKYQSGNTELNTIDSKNNEVHWNQKYHGFHIGYDKKIRKWIIGASFNHLISKDTYISGTGNGTITSGAFYGSQIKNNGSYFTFITKIGHIKNNYNVHTKNYIDEINGSYKTNAVLVSLEYGKRTVQKNGFYLEPSGTLTVSHIPAYNETVISKKGTHFTAHTDTVNSIIGKLSIAIGRKTEHLNVYEKLSISNEFNGEVKSTFFTTKDKLQLTSIKMKDTWIDLELGANYKINNSCYLFSSFTKNYDAKLNNKWHLDLGIHFVF